MPNSCCVPAVHLLCWSHLCCSRHCSTRRATLLTLKIQGLTCCCWEQNMAMRLWSKWPCSTGEEQHGSTAAHAPVKQYLARMLKHLQLSSHIGLHLLTQMITAHMQSASPAPYIPLLHRPMLLLVCCCQGQLQGCWLLNLWYSADSAESLWVPRVRESTTAAVASQSHTCALLLPVCCQGPTWGLLMRWVAQRCTMPAWEGQQHTWQLSG
jgi:hypothetical protein